MVCSSFLQELAENMTKTRKAVNDSLFLNGL
jgi:hypothetical protein